MIEVLVGRLQVIKFSPCRKFESPFSTRFLCNSVKLQFLNRVWKLAATNRRVIMGDSNTFESWCKIALFLRKRTATPRWNHNWLNEGFEVAALHEKNCSEVRQNLASCANALWGRHVGEECVTSPKSVCWEATIGKTELYQKSHV